MSAPPSATGRSSLAVSDGPGADLAGRPGAARASSLEDADTATLLHADMHNHTLLSDGAGSPEDAYAAMRSAGLDVAALTDHASVAREFPLPAPGSPGWDDDALSRYRIAPHSIDADGWARTGRLADEFDAPGEFTAIRGFEWTEPWLGHINVWFSEQWTDVRELGSTAALFDWLSERKAGREDGVLAGLNHPGREPGRFEHFRHDQRLQNGLVSLEMFNRGDDYLFEGWRDGRPSPLLAALDAGWTPGLLGVTDEHGRSWGSAEGRGRAGIWVHEHSRAGVAAAMRARRFYATRLSGLRLDARCDGSRMGERLTGVGGAVRLEVDVDRGPGWAGRPLEAQLLRPGGDDLVPEVVARIPVTSGATTCQEVPIGPPPPGGRPDWLVLRIADPSGANRTPGPRGHAANALAVAYASPWWLGGPGT